MDFAASRLRSSGPQSNEASAPSAFVGMKAIRATSTVRIVQQGLQVSS